ncbi:MAG: hypothetical protein GWP91_13815 [Rhodobacterales bacterium]|nr:hypothetical protein [Rhodobacterales bacterium]
MDEEIQEITGIFIQESRETLDLSVPMLIALEQGASTDSSVVAAIFRLFHNIKGSAGFLELHTIQRLTQNAEDTLDAIRNEKLVPDAQLVDVLYKVTELTAELLYFVEANGTDKDPELDARTEELVVQLLTMLNPNRIASPMVQP